MQYIFINLTYNLELLRDQSSNICCFWFHDFFFRKHDVKVVVAIPQNTYASNLHLINNQEVKNLTLRLDLEKTLYFTTQVQFSLEIN